MLHHDGWTELESVYPVVVHPKKNSFVLTFTSSGEHQLRRFRQKDGWAFDFFFLFLEKAILSVDGSLISGDVIRRVSMFEPDPGGEWSVVGLPRGRVYTCWSYTLGGVPFIVIPHKPIYPASIFPTLRDLEVYVPSAAASSVSWSVFTGELRVVGDMKSVLPNPSIATEVAAAVADCVVTSWTDRGRTAGEIQMRCPDRSITSEKLRILFKSRASMAVWRGDDLVSLQWVPISGVRFSFPGDRRPGFLNGMGVSEAYGVCLLHGKGSFKFEGSAQYVRGFKFFLRNNGFLVRYHFESPVTSLSYLRVS